MTMAISSWKASRRSLLLRASALGITSLVRLPAQAGVGDQPSNPSSNPKARKHMSKIITKDGTEIYYKDWGTGRPTVVPPGWPPRADEWDNQMMFCLAQGDRVIAHGRRGHGRSTQTFIGNDM